MAKNNFKIDGSLTTAGNLVVHGDLEIKGTSSTVNTETLTVNDNIIVTNAYGAATPYTGVVSVTGNTTKGILPGTKLIFKSTLPTTFNPLTITGNFSASENYGNGNLIFTKDYIAIGDGVFGGVLVGNKIYDNNANQWSGPYLIPEFRYITYTGTSTLLLNTEELNTLSNIFENVPILDREEAYASAIFNTETNEIQLGKGYITRKEGDKVEFTFGDNENQAVATRDSNIQSGLVCYDKRSNKLINAMDSKEGLSLPGLTSVNGMLLTKSIGFISGYIEEIEEPDGTTTIILDNTYNGKLKVGDKLTFNDKQIATLEDVNTMAAIQLIIWEADD